MGGMCGCALNLHCPAPWPFSLRTVPFPRLLWTDLGVSGWRTLFKEFSRLFDFVRRPRAMDFRHAVERN